MAAFPHHSGTQGSCFNLDEEVKCKPVLCLGNASYPCTWEPQTHGQVVLLSRQEGMSLRGSDQRETQLFQRQSANPG